jgi:hypothetical protein
LIVLTLAAALVVLVAFVLSQIFRSAPPAPSPSDPTTSASRSDGMPFEYGSTIGHWSIGSPRWDDSRVTVTVDITVDKGLLPYQFYAYTVASTDDAIIYPVIDGPDSLDSGYVRAGQSLSGSLTFRTKRQDLTLIMAGESVQISALPISA